MFARIVTAAIAIPVALAAMFWQAPWGVLALASILAVLGLREYANLAKADGAKFSVPGYAVLIVAVASAAMTSQWAKTGLVVLLGAAALGIVSVLQLISEKRTYFWGQFGGLWVSAPLASLVLWHQFSATSSPLNWTPAILYALLPLWVGDSLGIFVGKGLGKHPMAPGVSPKKTWEGGIANFLGCVGMGLGWSLLRHDPIWIGITCGLIAGTFGQLGDLMQSALKRKADLKDSGSLLPGHGGILDRLDSMLMTACPIAIIAIMNAR